jgi:hypothetical protein
MHTIRRDTWIHMGDRMKYMDTDGNIEAQREQETMQKAINRHGTRRPKLFCCRWIRLLSSVHCQLTQLPSLYLPTLQYSLAEARVGAG